MSTSGATNDVLLPLKGVRVLTFEAFGAGPFGSMYLADLGADVIKIESRELGGDATRGMGPYLLGPGDSEFFQTFNLNKRSVSFNLKTPEGRQLFQRLVAKSDAVFNNLRGDQPDKLGLTYAALGSINPRIVCAHISAYGRDNERRNWPGYDYLMQAEAGYLDLSGEPGSPPARMGLSIVDFMTGITAALALVSTLLGVARSGRGRDVDVSLFDVAFHQLSYPGTWYLNEGHETTRLPRSAHPSAVPVQLFKSSDGWIFVMCMTEKFWQEFLDVLGRPADLAADPRFKDAPSRGKHRDELTPLIDAHLQRDTTAAWLTKFQSRLPAAPVYKMGQALDSPFPAAIGMVRPMPHPTRSNLRVLGNPIKLDGKRLPGRHAPALGADNESVLTELGIEPADQARLRELGAL